MSKRIPMIVSAAPFGPDMPDYRSDESSNAMNVIPRTPKSYGPLPTPQVFSGALNARCQGAYFGVDSNGNVSGFAGDATKLYRLTASSSSWVDVSKGGGYAINSTDQWHFALYGTYVIATDYADPPQLYTIDSPGGTFLNLSSAAPSARFVATVKSFLVLADTNDPNYGVQRRRVWWSANGNPLSWPDPTTQAQLAAQYESNFQDLLGEGGWIKGIVGNLGNADAVIIMEHALWRIVFAGAPTVFDFFPIEGARGTPASGSIAQVGGIFYYLGEDGFYANDGGLSVPIGANLVDKTFYADVDQNYLGNISSAVDTINKLYVIFYPGAGNISGNPNKMLIYNWQLQRWSEAVPLNPGGELVARAISFGYTLDQLYTILGYSLDTLPAPLDSPLWTSGKLLLAIFDTAHKLNFFTGVALPASVDTSESQPNPAGVTRIINTRPIIDGTVMPTVSIGVRNRQVDTPIFGTPVTMTALGTAPQRAVGRYIRARITVPSSSSWTNLSGCELEGVPLSGRY